MLILLIIKSIFFIKLYTKQKYIFYTMDNNLIYSFSILNLNI